MATERQIAANQRNAQLSTGPRSPAGKAVSSQNHRTHGFSSNLAVLTEPGDRELFDYRVEQYLLQYGTGKIEDIFRATTAVNAEFQYIYINRSRKAFCQYGRERAVDHLWGAQRMPDDPADAFDLNTRLAGYAVMRDLAGEDVLLKMNRYEKEQIRNANTAIDKLQQQYQRIVAKSGDLAPEDQEKVNQAIETFRNNGNPAPTTQPSTTLERGVENLDPDVPSDPEIAPEPAAEGPAAAEPDAPNTPVHRCVTAPYPEGEVENAASGPEDHPIHDSNPIPDIPEPIQQPDLCKNRPEIDSCPVCRHPQKEQLRYLLGRPHDIHQISADWQIPVLDLWRCRLHHIENPGSFYDIVGISVQKARLLDKTNIQPMILIEDKNRPLGINIPISEYSKAEYQHAS